MLQNPFPLESRKSSGSSTSTLSATTLRPGVGGFTSPGSSNSGANGYSYVTPPTSPRVPYDYVSSPHETVASWVSENTSYFSASSSFDTDVLSPSSPPPLERGLNERAQPLSSTPRNLDLITGISPSNKDSTPPLVPFTSGVTSSNTNLETRQVSRDEPVPKSRTPVPIPRRGTVSSSSRPTGSLSRSVSDASDARLNFAERDNPPPPVKPRKSLHFPADQGPKSPPPKPPRTSQSPATKAPPPLPKPYVSKSVDSSPAAQRKAVNSERKET